MHGIIIATGYSTDLEPLISKKPDCLFKVVNKDAILHTIDTLHKLKVEHIDIILHHFPEAIKQSVSGSRWGVSIKFHIAKDVEFPLQPMQPLISSLPDEKRILLADATQIPHFQEKDVLSIENQQEITFITQDKTWSGWLLGNKNYLNQLTLLKKEELANFVTQQSTKLITLKDCLSIHTFKDLHHANLSLIKMESPFTRFPTSSRMVEDKIWLSRNVIIHPSAKIHPPCFIGKNCQIAAHSTIGPHAIIENNCIIDTHSRVSNSVICENSYVGESLSVENSVVDHGLLTNIKLNTKLPIVDQMVISSFQKTSLVAIIEALIERSLALILLFLFIPLWIYLFCTHSIKNISIVKLPMMFPHPTQWSKYKLFEFHHQVKASHWKRRLPNLLHVFLGNMHLVGIQARTQEEISNLPADWRELLSQSKVGLIHPTDLLANNASEEDIFICEVYYIAHQGFKHDCKIFSQYLYKKIKSLFSKEKKKESPAFSKQELSPHLTSSEK